MNGTSMASPHAAGAVALLISGLLQRNLPYSPFSIKRALWDSATYLSHVDPFAQGNGLLNVEKTFENLVQFSDAPDRDVRYVNTSYSLTNRLDLIEKLNFSFAVTVGTNLAKGIHLRYAEPVPKEYLVVVEPVFMNEKEIGNFVIFFKALVVVELLRPTIKILLEIRKLNFLLAKSTYVFSQSCIKIRWQSYTS